MRNSLKFLEVCLAICSLMLTACSSTFKASSAPTTPFLVHGSELHPWYDRAPFDAVWSAQPGKVVTQQATVRKIYIAPINTDYLNKTLDKDGQWVVGDKLSTDDVKAFTTYLRQSFVNAIKRNSETNLQIVEQSGVDTLTLAIALVELQPTRIGVNAATDIGGLVVPGSKLIMDAGVVGTQAASGAISGGVVAVEMKLIDGATGAVVAEAKDREADPASVLPNYKDFEEYGWSRETADDWANEVAKLFSTPADKKVADQVAEVSFAPW